MNTAFVVDDEPLARKRIENLLRDYQTVKLVGQSGDVQESIKAINEKKPDILFLDIQLKAKKGFQILETIDHVPIVVFTTAYSEYAVKAFDYYAIDYLLKPFNDERFHQSVSRALELLQQQGSNWDKRMVEVLAQLEKSPSRGAYLVRIPIRIADKTHFVNTKDIWYIKASAYYAELFAESGKHIVRESMSSLIENLDPSAFIRVHRSSIINVNYLEEITAIGFGDIEIKMKDGEHLRVSKSYKDQLVKMLGMK